MKKALDTIFKYSSIVMLILGIGILFKGCDLDNAQQKRGVVLLLGYAIIAIFWYLFAKQQPKS